LLPVTGAEAGAGVAAAASVFVLVSEVFDAGEGMVGAQQLRGYGGGSRVDRLVLVANGIAGL
jgi:hypothetical protein